MHYRASLFDKQSSTNTSSSSNNHCQTSPSQRRGSALMVDIGSPIQALPGRPKRRRAVGSGSRRRRNGSVISLGGLVQQIWTNCKGLTGGFTASLWIAIILWYSLGILSIATSKVLLSGDVNGMMRVSPLTLTLQQLLIGSSLLRFLLQIRLSGSSGLKAFPAASSNDTHVPSGQQSTAGRRELFMASICFSLGFLATNFGFAGSAASFVETVKAAEPLTSATVAAAYGIEMITMQQKASLGTIVAGVLLSTLGGSGSSTSSQSLFDVILSCVIVMSSNLFFSFRGLYQKLFRKHTSAQVLDDLNLQYRMQWTGVMLLAIPTLFLEFVPAMWYGNYFWTSTTTAGSENDDSPYSGLMHYCMLALLNGCAFTSYNLASTYILSRISVVHHAALNCIRRVFAIIVTSALFGVPITGTSAAGICLAVVGFMSYTYYKVQQQQASLQRHSKQPLCSLLPVSVTH